MGNVITGTGLVCSVGSDTKSCFAAFCQGLTGNKPLQAFDVPRYNVRRAYEVSDRPAGRDPKGRSSRWLCAAINEALHTSGLLPGPDQRLAVVVGTGLRELRSLELWWADGQPLVASELHFAGAVHAQTPLRARVVTLCNACSASSFALGVADDMLALGQADAVVVAGSDSITESMFGLADRTNGLHPQELQPFDHDRRGVVLGEGAAAVVLEPAAAAAARGATARARLRGVGLSCDAHHETAPLVEGVARAMRDAYRRSSLSPDEVDLVMAHGTGTALNDPTELAALRQVFGDRAPAVMITGLKSMTGHTSGASGLMSAIAAMEAMHQGRVPPTVGLRTPMAEAAGLDLVVSEARQASVRVAQVNAFGFGGVNAVALLERAV